MDVGLAEPSRSRRRLRQRMADSTPVSSATATSYNASDCSPAHSAGLTSECRLSRPRNFSGSPSHSQTTRRWKWMVSCASPHPEPSSCVAYQRLAVFSAPGALGKKLSGRNQQADGAPGRDGDLLTARRAAAADWIGDETQRSETAHQHGGDLEVGLSISVRDAKADALRGTLSVNGHVQESLIVDLYDCRRRRVGSGCGLIKTTARAESSGEKGERRRFEFHCDPAAVAAIDSAQKKHNAFQFGAA